MTAGADITTDLEFSLWKGNSKIYGEYVSTSKTVTYEYTPSITATYRINFRLRDYGYDGADQTFYLDNVIIRNTALALIEENNYYPFGLKHQGYNFVVSSNTNTVATKFKYNGKELNDELGLDLYDYGARFYDPALGRFHTLDLRAEAYSFQSPYVYAGNKPINSIDFNGEFPLIPIAWGAYEAVVALTAATAITTTAVSVHNIQNGTHTSRGKASNYGEKSQDKLNRNMQYWSPKFKFGFFIVSSFVVYKNTTDEIDKVNTKLKSKAKSSPSVSPTVTDPLYVTDPEYWNKLKPNQRAGYMMNLLNNLVTSPGSSTTSSTSSSTTSSTSSSTTSSTNSSTTSSTNSSTTSSTSSSERIIN